jgi:hypothetical protein
MRKILTPGMSDVITKPEVGNPRHKKKNVLLFLVFAIALVTTTLSVPTIINAQGSPSGDNNGGSSGTDKQQMGICVVGADGPCNGDERA